MKHILKNGGDHDGTECNYTVCYSGNHAIKNKCLGWCEIEQTVKTKSVDSNSEQIKIMRARFTVQSVKEFGYGGKEAELTAVYSGKPEDNEFAKATPSGSIKILVDNPAAKDFLVPGKTYNIDFSLVE